MRLDQLLAMLRVRGIERMSIRVNPPAVTLEGRRNEYNAGFSRDHNDLEAAIIAALDQHDKESNA